MKPVKRVEPLKPDKAAFFDVSPFPRFRRFHQIYRFSRMILYNVTCKVDSVREIEWIQWMREIHVPEVCEKGSFLGATFMRLKFPVEDEGVTYAIQYKCTSMQTLERYLSEHAPALQLVHILKFGTDVVAFRTILEVVGEYGEV